MKYAQLKAKRDAIEAKMKKAQLAERKEVIKKIRTLCKEYNITANHLKGALADGRKRRRKKATPSS